jgi:hypothetical protein
LRTLFLAAAAALLIAPAAASAAPFTIGTGDDPNVAVDGSGTAYIAWAESAPDSSFSTLHFCRLPRGATVCEGQPIITEAGNTISRPFVTVAGSTVRIVHSRYGVPNEPFSQNYGYTSTNGGNSFGAGVRFGDLPFDNAVVRTGEQIAMVSTAGSGDGRFLQQPLAAPTGATPATLVPGRGQGAVGVGDDGQLVAVFAGADGQASVRTFSGLGDPNNAGLWSAAAPIGAASYPHLSGGPAGLFLLAGNQTSGVSVRRWNGAAFGPEVTLAASAEEPQAHLYQDAGGRLHAVYSRFDSDGIHFVHGVSDDGVSWAQGSVAVQSGLPASPRVAAAADHVGVAVWSTGKTILASVIGPGAPAVAPPTQPPPVQPPPPAEPAPQFNQTFVVRPVRGTVRVRLRGSNRFVNITSIDDIPFGATIDTKRGEVELRSVASRTGAVQSVRLFDGWFRVSFSGGITNFTLNEPLARCPRRGSAAQRKPKSRKLWGNGKGRFRTTGNYSAATVRGTRWLVQDTCAGTRTRVTQGSVRVRDRIRRRTVTVSGPRGSYLARPRR